MQVKQCDMAKINQQDEYKMFNTPDSYRELWSESEILAMYNF